MEYRTAHTEEDYAAAAALFRQYAASIGISLSFQHFDEELQELRQMYSQPQGGIILCADGGTCIACTGVRKIDTQTAELKRMFVQPGYQGRGIGRVLMEKALELARSCGYTKMQLDTLSSMTPAINLYRQSGFYEIPAYYHNPIPTAVYFEKLL